MGVLALSARSLFPSGDTWISAALRPPPQYSTDVLVENIFGWKLRARSFSRRPSVLPEIGSRVAWFAYGNRVISYMVSEVGVEPRAFTSSMAAPAMCIQTASY